MDTLLADSGAVSTLEDAYARCEKLAKTICEGKDDAYCEKARKWVDKEMVGPDGKKMNGAQSNMACKMIVEDSQIAGLYKANAAEELAKN